jgi:hypothetical protein
MSTLATMTVGGKTVNPINFLTSSLRTVAFTDEVSVSGIQTATVSFEIDLEEETDSDAFFATWFLDKSKKDANVDILPAGAATKFLTVQCLDAQCISYTLNIDQRIDTNKQNSTISIQLACLSITVGPSPLTLGF